MSPIRVIVQPLPGARRVELRCPCARAGMVAPLADPLADVVATLLARHRRVAPRCRHPAPSIGAQP
jgi:hypothetical protein